MKNPISKSIRMKIIVPFVILSITIVFVSSFLYYENSAAIYKDQVLKHHLQRVQTTANQIEDYVAFSKNDIKLIPDLPIVYSYFRASKLGIDDQTGMSLDETRYELEKVLTTIIQDNKGVHQIRIIDINGIEKIKIIRNENNEIISLDESQLQNKSDRYYFQDSINLESGQIFISRLELNEEYGKVAVPHIPNIRYASPLIDQFGERHGIVVLNSDFSEYMKVVASSALGDGLMLNQKGMMLVHPDKEKTFASQLENDFNYFDEQPELKINLEKQDFQIHYDIEESEYRIWSKVFYNNLDRNYYWVVLDRIPESELLAPLLDLANTTYIITGMGIIISVLVIVLVSRILTKPIKVLERTISKVKDGNFESKIKIKRDDEYGSIINTINEMVDTLKQTQILRNGYEKELEKTLKKLKNAEAMKEEFASMVTHELKTPLTPIKGYCEMLKEPGLIGKLNSDQLNAVEEIEDSSNQLERLISDVLDAQKIDMSRMKFSKKQFELNDFMSNINESYLSLMKAKNIEFVNTTNTKLTLTSDPHRLEQVLSNLIKNAVDFVPQKGGKIEIGASQQDSNVVFYVKDNGIGIEKEKQDHIFKKFYQIDTSITRKHGGTGLGLVICKGIIEGLGGKIWVESEPGIGSIFYCSIPIMIKVRVDV